MTGVRSKLHLRRDGRVISFSVFKGLVIQDQQKPRRTKRASRLNSDENPRDDEKPQDHDHVSSDERSIQGEVDEELQEEVYREFVVPESANQLRIDLFLTQSCDGYSRTQIRNAVQNDAAAVDGKKVRPSFKLQSGQHLRFKVPPLP